MGDPFWRYRALINRHFGGSLTTAALAGESIFMDDGYWFLADFLVDSPRPSAGEAAEIGLGFADALAEFADL